MHVLIFPVLVFNAEKAGKQRAGAPETADSKTPARTRTSKNTPGPQQGTPHSLHQKRTKRLDLEC